jgi:hypothetical protein
VSVRRCLRTLLDDQFAMELITRYWNPGLALGATLFPAPTLGCGRNLFEVFCEVAGKKKNIERK